MEKMKLEFTIDQLNLIVAALGRMPYESVFTIITDIQNQVQTQIAQQNDPRDVGPPPKSNSK
jgi:hypothetical protein